MGVSGRDGVYHEKMKKIEEIGLKSLGVNNVLELSFSFFFPQPKSSFTDNDVERKANYELKVGG